MRKALIVVVVLVLGGLAWWGFGRKAETQVGRDDPLAFVPADTPYVFANIEALPADLMKRYMANADPEIGRVRRQIKQALDAMDEALKTPAASSDDAADAQSDAGDDDAEAVDISDDADDADDARPDAKTLALLRRTAGWLRAVDAELAATPTAEALIRRIGVDTASKTALYGVGLVPVVRITLADPAAFESLVDRLQKASGDTLPPLTMDGVDAGWRIAIDEVPIHGIIAIVGRQLVLTLAPAKSEDGLRSLLGLERPAKTLADSGELQRFIHDEGLLPFGAGYLDTARLVKQFQIPATPLESAFLAVFETEKPMLPAECQADAARLVAAVPRLVAGYSHLDAQAMGMLMRIETSPDIAKALMTLRSPLVGLGRSKDALGAFGGAFKVSALPAMADSLVAIVNEKPWTCPALADIDEAAASLRTSLNNPAVYAAGPVYNSFLVAIDTLDFNVAESRLDDLTARLVIGSDNPASLIATARSFVPELASLKLEPDAAPQSVPAEFMAGKIDQPAFVGMSKTALGLVIGKGEEAKLAGYLGAGDTRQPVLYMRYRGALMVELARIMREFAATLPEDSRQELIDNAQIMEDAYGNSIESMEFSLELAPKGIEFHQSIEMKQR